MFVGPSYMGWDGAKGIKHGGCHTKNQFTLLYVGLTMQTMSNEQLINAIDWKQIFPVALELIKEFLKPTKDWQKIFSLGIELVKIIMQAEQTTGLAINWAKLIQLIMTLINLIGAQAGQSWWQWLIELLMQLFNSDPPSITTTTTPGESTTSNDDEFTPLP